MDFLFSAISDLKINKYFTDRIKNLVGGSRIIDLLFHLPRYFLERKKIEQITEEDIGKNVILKLRVVDHIPPIKGRYGRKTPYQVVCINDKRQNVVLSFFNYKTPQYLKKILPINSLKIISGKIQRFNNDFEISHPEYIVEQNEGYKIPECEPIYSLTAGITNAFLTRLIRSLFSRIPEVDEWFDARGAKISWRNAVIMCHTNLDNELARQRLALDEILSIKQALNDLRSTYTKGENICVRNFFENGVIKQINSKDNIASEKYYFDYDKFTKNFGFKFELTNDQKSAITDIISDLNSDKKMSRLLQGDVGSGKTMVAFITAMYSIFSGKNVALLAPTEMLAKQHMEVFKNLLANFEEKFLCDIILDLLVSKTKSKSELYKRLKAGEVNILIGTHAIIEEKVEISNLGYVIIDEQHKFGVEQRGKLKNKNPLANVLYMSATPIPRTLMMVLNNDMDISYIKEKPKNRIPVETVIMPISKITDLILRLKTVLVDGNRAFWVCPAIEMSETMPITSVTERFEYLKNFFGEDIAIVHGKMKEQERAEIIEKFRSDQVKILIATTVIEVGIDVPDANVIVIENAERFGLSQLHQLRGRVGRGSKKSFCVLLYSSKLTCDAQKRLAVMKESSDGFRIAEKDLEIRGYGDYVGTRQTGLPLFRVTDPFKDQELFSIASKMKIKKNKDLLYKIYKREI